MNKNKHYLISDASRQVQVEAHVLRYWEDELGLPIPRNELGHRYYTEFHIQLFRQIKQLKEQGYQLKAIRGILGKVEENQKTEPEALLEAQAQAVFRETGTGERNMSRQENMAPGMNRSFLSESWTNLIPKKCWYDAIDEATEMVDDTVKVDIQGYDIDGEVIKAARENAERAGVDHMIHFQERPVAQLSHPKKYGFIITNPPYGERIEEKKNLPALYKTIGERFKALDSWSMYLITAYEDAERYIGRKADKNRKIYNGMMKTYYYQFMGPKPPRRKTGDQVEA